MRERVKVKMLSPGAWGLNGRLRSRNSRVAKKRTFRARPALAGRGRGCGRDASATRRLRK